MQSCLDTFFYCRKFIMDCVTFLSIRIYGIECSFEEVSKRKYSGNDHLDLNLDAAGDVDTLLSLAKDRHKESLDRRSFVTDKVKTLVTWNSALLGILAAFLPKATEFESPLLTGIFYCGVLLVLNALIMIWLYFDIKGETVLELEQEEVGLDSKNLKKSLINSHLRCQADTDKITDFLADLYKAARFYLLSGFLIVFVVVSLCLLIPFKSQNSSTPMIEELRGNPDLIELLRGPKGLKGDRGIQGPKGETGPQGELGMKGEQGPKAWDDDKA